MVPALVFALVTLGVTATGANDFSDRSPSCGLAPEPCAYLRLVTSVDYAHDDKDSVDEAIASFTGQIELYPNDAEWYFRRGNAYADRGLGWGDSADFAKAIADYTQAIKLGLDGEWSIDVHLHRGRVHEQVAQYDQAVADLTTVLKLDFELAHARNRRGSAARDMGESALLHQAIQLQLDVGKRADAHFYRGIAHQKLGNYEQATADFTAAIQLGVRLADAFANRGYTYEKSGDRESALADFREALVRAPSNQMAIDGLKRLDVTP